MIEKNPSVQGKVKGYSICFGMTDKKFSIETTEGEVYTADTMVEIDAFYQKNKNKMNFI